MMGCKVGIFNKKYSDFVRCKNFREFDVNTHISLKNRYIYFQISKAASSTVKYYLQNLEVKGTGRKVINVNDRNLSPHVWPSQLREADFYEMINSSSWKKIAFVRNPYARLLSCYLHRVVGDLKSASNKVLSKYTGGRIGSDVSFEEFVKIVCSQETASQEAHWRVQSEDIYFHLIPKFDCIGKVENLETDICKMLTLLTGKSVQISLDVDKSPATTKASIKLREYYTEDLRKIVFDRYRLDFDNFGYSEYF